MHYGAPVSGAGAETVQVTTSDAVVLDADVNPADPASTDAGTPRGSVVLCHPHPQYGGSRHDQVVTALFDTLPGRGYTALRFDFRRAYGGGIDERLDVVAAIGAALERAPTSVVHVVGYSFGAMVTLGVIDERIASRTLVAPPFPMDPAGAEAGPTTGPTLVVVPEHDQYCPPDAARPVVAGWRERGADVTFETVSMADHFLAGRAGAVADLVVDWLTAR